MIRNTIMGLVLISLVSVIYSADDQGKKLCSKEKELPAFEGCFHVGAFPYSDSEKSDVIFWRVVFDYAYKLDPWKEMRSQKDAQDRVEFHRIVGKVPFINHLRETYKEHCDKEIDELVEIVAKKYVKNNNNDLSKFLNLLDEVDLAVNSDWENDMGSFYINFPLKDVAASPALAKKAAKLYSKFQSELPSGVDFSNYVHAYLEKHEHQGSYVAAVGGGGKAVFLERTRKVSGDSLSTGWIALDMQDANKKAEDSN